MQRVVLRLESDGRVEVFGKEAGTDPRLYEHFLYCLGPLSIHEGCPIEIRLDEPVLSAVVNGGRQTVFEFLPRSDNTLSLQVQGEEWLKFSYHGVDVFGHQENNCTKIFDTLIDWMDACLLVLERPKKREGERGRSPSLPQGLLRSAT